MRTLITTIATVMLLLAGSLIWKAKASDNEWCWKSGTSNEELHTR